MAKTLAVLEASMRRSPRSVRFADAMRVAEHYFGKPRSRGTSHKVFRTPWPMDPRVNLQPTKSGEAKAYQIRQLMSAIDKLNSISAAASDEDAEEI